MAEEKPEAQEIRVRRREMMVPTVEGEPEAVMYISYTVKGLPAGLIRIRKAEWTEEKEAELIRQDIEARRVYRPVTVRI